jgi:hypothetical protein
MSIPENFKFADQHSQVYPCNLVIAQLLSPRVVELLSTDAALDWFDIEVANEDDFSIFVSLLHRGTADFSVDHLPSYISLARQLGNYDLMKQFVSLHPLPSELTPSNILEELKFYEMVGAVPAPELLRFASANFYRLTEIFSHQLKPQTLDLIFSVSLVVESEDAFFDFVKEEIGDGSLDLLRHVDLLYLSGEKIREFLSLLDLTTLTQGIWERIQFTVQSIRPDPLHTSPIHRYGTVYRPGANYFDGIFANFNRACSGNCAEKGIIEVTSSQTCCGKPTVIFADSDWSGSHQWHAGNVSSIWFKADFKSRRVAITHYAIHKCSTDCPDTDQLKTWAVEGSNSDSDSDWTVIDGRRDDQSLYGKSTLQALFECNGDTVHEFRYIRLIQRGPCHNTTNLCFRISQFEIFGVLSSTE